jgi:hypothetical protein
MPYMFYIPIHYTPPPPLPSLHHSQIMPFLPSVGFQRSHWAHHNNNRAQQWAAFTYIVQYTARYE